MVLNDYCNCFFNFEFLFICDISYFFSLFIYEFISIFFVFKNEYGFFWIFSNSFFKYFNDIFFYFYIFVYMLVNFFFNFYKV